MITATRRRRRRRRRRRPSRSILAATSLFYFIRDIKFEHNKHTRGSLFFLREGVVS
jgi:hypothetical protein